MDGIISKELIVLDLEASTKEQAIKELAKIIKKNGHLIDFNGYIEQVFKREEISATSVVFDIAIPHGKCISVKSPAVAFGRLKNEVRWNEREKAKYIFLIAVPEKEGGDNDLHVLAKLARKIMQEEFRVKLKKAVEVQEILDVLTEIYKT